LYNKETEQITTWATLTDDTPGIIAALLDDPSTDSDTRPAGPATTQGTISHSAPFPYAGIGDQRS